jgi:hypothetical protein
MQWACILTRLPYCKPRAALLTVICHAELVFANCSRGSVMWMQLTRLYLYGLSVRLRGARVGKPVPLRGYSSAPDYLQSACHRQPTT